LAKINFEMNVCTFKLSKEKLFNIRIGKLKISKITIVLIRIIEINSVKLNIPGNIFHNRIVRIDKCNFV
jgi:hypothetical protein